MSALILNDMVWPEVEAAKEKIEICLIPIGSCEQHGPSMTFETDTARADSFAKMIGEIMGERALICPTITYGLSPHHMPFPGTITLRAETFISLVCDVCIALKKHGFKKFAFLNGHGGNNTALDVAVNKLKYEYDIDAMYTPIGGRIAASAVQPEWNWDRARGHACECEGSQSLVLCPRVVRDERIPGDMNEKFVDLVRTTGSFTICGTYAYNWRSDYTENGALGDVRKANAEYGKIFNDKALSVVHAAIEAFIAREIREECNSSIK